MKDRVIVITGASSGIGEALARVCAERGAKLVLAARRTPEVANATCLSADVSKRADNERIRDAALQAYGGLDVWVANAGRGISRAVADLTDDDIDDMMQTNFKSVVYGIQAVLPHFKQQQRGQIIAVSSMLGRIPLASIRSAYSAAKAAVNSIMTSLRLELAVEYPAIFASTFLPGVVATDFGKNALHGGPDSRVLPMSQPVDEVAVRLAQLIEQPRAEAYSRPELQQLAARYFAADDVAPIEAQFASRPPR
jgi:NAD(P)-dependent dehydrogenase (short-subunit alcohol dehydrogenase family)